MSFLLLLAAVSLPATDMPHAASEKAKYFPLTRWPRDDANGKGFAIVTPTKLGCFFAPSTEVWCLRARRAFAVCSTLKLVVL